MSALQRALHIAAFLKKNLTSCTLINFIFVSNKCFFELNFCNMLVFSQNLLPLLILSKGRLHCAFQKSLSAFNFSIYLSKTDLQNDCIFYFYSFSCACRQICIIKSVTTVFCHVLFCVTSPHR